MKTRFNISQLLTYAVFIFFAFSCQNNVEEVVSETPDVDPADLVSFKDNVKPIIDSNCIQCHNGGQFPDLRTYDLVSANAIRVGVRVGNRTMPLGGSLTQTEIDFVVDWVAQGALDN